MGPVAAYHIILHAYGTWLPGEPRGWKDRRFPEVQCGSSGLLAHAVAIMAEQPVEFKIPQRLLIAEVIREHCIKRNWIHHVANVLKTHVHAVISAPVDGDLIRRQLKAWCSRRLNEQCGRREHWWGGKGYDRKLKDDADYQAVTHYVVEEQEERPLEHKQRTSGCQVAGSANDRNASART
jgi:REP element-mobilizing transposase RayT